jgi:uncharacterized membrane protein YozB (DUF420 family)
VIFVPGAGWLAQIGLCWAGISIGLLIWSWRLARRQRFRIHMRIMKVTTVSALVFVALTALRRVLPGAAAPELPAVYVPFMSVHIAIATATLIASLALIRAQTGAPELVERRAWLRRLRRHHRRLGPWVWCGWLLTFAGGICNYYALHGLP